MKRLVSRIFCFSVLTALLAALSIIPAFAAEIPVTLEAREGTLTMPDGAMVPVWGLARTGAQPFSPVPVISALEGDTLTISLANYLPEPTSLVINGQSPSEGGAMTPVFLGPDSLGRQRVRSFTHEAAAYDAGTATPGTDTYAWAPLKPGTYLIQSGTHPGVQIPMGLYAVLRVDAAQGVAYQTPVPRSYAKEAILLFSEIDPALNAAVSSGTYGGVDYPTALAAGYAPQYFLLNGSPWSPSKSPLATYLPYDPAFAGVNGAPAAVAPGEVTLLRILNAGLRSRVPVLQGPELDLVAEDGHSYSFAEKRQAVELPAAKTIDALFTAPTTPGYLPVYDRMLGLAGGGMFGYLTVGTPTRTLTVTKTPPEEGTVVAASLPGGIDCGIACSSTYLDGTILRLTGQPNPGLFVSWLVDGVADPSCPVAGDCTVTMNADKTVEAIFDFPFVLVRPQAGEILNAGAPYTFEWTAPFAATSFTLRYRTRVGTPWTNIVSGLNARNYTWPSVPAVGSTLQINLLAYNGATLIGSRTVQVNVNLPDFINITAPAAGQAVPWGPTTTTITWDSNHEATVAYTAIYYRLSPTSALRRITVLTGEPPGKSYPWTPPAGSGTYPGAQLYVYLLDSAGRPILFDVNTINLGAPPPAAALSQSVTSAPSSTVTSAAASSTASSATVTSKGLALSSSGTSSTATLILVPNGGEVFSQATGATLLWQASEQAAAFNLSYATAPQGPFTAIASGVTGSSFDWNIPAELQGNAQVWVKVTALDIDEKEVGSDLSDEPFAID